MDSRYRSNEDYRAKHIVTYASPSAAVEDCLRLGLVSPTGAWGDNLTVHECRQWSRTGCDILVPEAQRFIELMENNLPTLHPQMRETVAGAFPDVGDFLAGEPECMRGIEVQQSVSGQINFGVSLECVASVNAEAAKMRGLAILALALRMTALRPVNLVLCDWGANTHGKNTVGEDFSCVAVRMPTQPMHLGVAAFALTHIGFTRSVLYRLEGHHFGRITMPCFRVPNEHWQITQDCPYASWADRTEADAWGYAQACIHHLGWSRDDSMYITGANMNFKKAEDAVAWVARMSAKFGSEEFEA